MMGDFKRPLDYIDVAQRLREMREKYPEMSMQQVSMEFREFGGKEWVIYTAAAYRTPDDPRPGIGTAWEPVPGPTSFTRDSEVQNAETAAWGRALVAIGADTKSGIASAEEISNRSGNEQEGSQSDDPRVQAILNGAGHGNDFVDDIAAKIRKGYKMSEAQLSKASEAATKPTNREPIKAEEQVRQAELLRTIAGLTDEQKKELSRLWDENGLPSAKAGMNDAQIDQAVKIIELVKGSVDD